MSARAAGVPLALLGVAGVLGWSTPAHAYERQWHVGGGMGAAALVASESSFGPALGAFAAYGLSDALDLRMQVAGSHHQRSAPSFQLLGVSAGLAYRLDVLSWIPYLGAELGYYHFFGEGPAGLAPNQPGARVDLGLDYVLSPSVGLGFELSYHGFLEDVRAAVLFTGLLRAEYHWGW